jgi:hypothetical protein
MEDDQADQAESQLPYDAWAEQALRAVAVRALRYAAANGLPGEHHFYITFRTDFSGVVIPTRLLAKYPQEMTIVLQHQFWDLKVADDESMFSVGLSFGGVPSILRIPIASITGFADPHVRFGLRFAPGDAVPVSGGQDPAPEPAPDPAPTLTPEEQGPGAVVSLDKFRRRKD